MDGAWERECRCSRAFRTSRRRWAGCALVDADTPEHRTVRETLTRAWAEFTATGDPGWAVYADSAENSRAFAESDPGADTMITAPSEDELGAL